MFTIFKRKPKDELKELIEEKRKKQVAEVNKRSWCIEQAAMLNIDSPQKLIHFASEIYDYVYGDVEK